MKAYRAPAVAAIATVAAIGMLLILDATSPVLLLAAAAGAPLTVLLLVRAVGDPHHERRSLWPSFLIGAVLVPPIVLLLHGAFLALGFALVEPFAAAGRSLFEELRGDPVLLDLLTSGWTYFYLVELAVVAPLLEETVKPLGSVVRRPRSEMDAFLFGAAAGTGFAVVENLLYASGWFWGVSEYWVPISLGRMLGAGLHAFGAGMVAWGLYRVRSKTGGWRELGAAFVTAVTAHGLWNGTLAVTEVLYAGRAEFAAGLSDDGAAWGVTLMVVLTALGMVIVTALLLAARNLRNGDRPLDLRRLGLVRPEGVATWGLVSTALLVPAVILVLTFPWYVSL